MPNHVINNVTVSGDKEQIAGILEAIKSDEFGIGSIDFNKIIPMPESLNMESGSASERGLKAYKDFVDVCTFDGANADMDLSNIPEEKEKVFLEMRTDIDKHDWNLGRQAFRNELQYGAPTWYEWCIKNWGTKWNAYGFDEYLSDEIFDEEATIVFQTAWSAPHPILTKFAAMHPDVSIKHTWADEAIGENCGFTTYEGGECKGVYYPQGKEAERFAIDAWGYETPEEEMAFVPGM